MRYFLSAVSICLAAFFSSPVQASSSHTDAELFSEVRSIQPGTPFWVALRLKMDQRWHTYWRNPGDSGIPTELRWKLPEGFTAGPLLWPYPVRVDLPPLAVYAYEGEVLFLTQITPPATLAPGQSQALRAQAYWLECEVNCIPGDASLELELPVRPETPETNPVHAEDFARARSRMPLTSSEWQVTAQGSAKQILFRLKPPAGDFNKISGVSFFPYDEKLIQHPAAQRFRETPEAYELLVERSSLQPGVPGRIEGILVSREGWRGANSEKALEIDLPVDAAEGKGWSDLFRPGTTLGLALLLAFAGGLILNLMPCVFPVLSLKILHFVEQARQHRTHIFLQGVNFTAGVLVSFWVLAGALIFFRSAGHEIGWGFQLQSPPVVISLVLLFFIFALNLFGVFEVGLSVSGAAGKASRKTGKLSVFLNGVLATTVATPCTAPFMGAALGFAVTRPAAEAMLVFTSVGAGMSAPYLLLSAFPQLLKSLPKPGPWMVKLKKILAIFLLLTAMWLAWVLNIQSGQKALIGLLSGLFFLSSACWIYGAKIQRSQANPFWRWAAILLFCFGAAVSFTGLLGGGQRIHTGEGFASGLRWENFSEARLSALRREGKPALVDFTAAWCLTCQVNERVALGAEKVKERLKSEEVVLLKADWTSRDAEITRALAGYGRNSVPLYVLYGRGQGEPVFLPEILTPSGVLDILDKVFPKKDSNEKSDTSSL